MRLAISNLAFKDQRLADVAAEIKSAGLAGVELAPGLIWDAPLDSTQEERRNIKKLIASAGLQCVGLQAVLFGRPDLQMLGDAATRKHCLDYLDGMAQLCRDLGGGILSLGAAKNRLRQGRSAEEVWPIMKEFLCMLGERAAQYQVTICLEPVAADYGGDFLCTVEETARMVTDVAHPAVRLMIDTGSMRLNDEPFAETFKQYQSLIEHIHINEPFLKPPADDRPHRAFARELQSSGYKNFLSLECLASCFKDILPKTAGPYR